MSLMCRLKISTNLEKNLKEKPPQTLPYGVPKRRFKGMPSGLEWINFTPDFQAL